VLLAALALAACGRVESLEVRRDPAADLLLVRAGPDGAPQVLRREAGAPVAVAPELKASWAPAVTHDGVRTCFLGRDARGRVGLYVGLRGETVLARLKAPADAHSAPAWLPDGRIVFAAPAPDGSRALYTIDPSSDDVRRITFSGTDAADPTVLRDGRVLYVGVSRDRDADGAPGLFSVHPDGTGVALFHDATPARAYARPRQATDGSVVFLARGERTRAVVLDWRAPQEEGSVLPLREEPRAVEPRADGSWLVVAGDGLLALASDGAVRPVEAPAGVTDACAAGPRPRPQGQLSMVDPHGTRGRLLCLDARPDGTPAAGLSVRVLARGTARWRALGDVRAKADGSFFAVVPADTPLRLEVRDATGAVRGGTRTPFWVRPREIRGCIGCHAPQDATPPNRMPAAALEDAVDPAAPASRRRGS
jgi:hypothetical protein